MHVYIVANYVCISIYIYIYIHICITTATTYMYEIITAITRATTNL